MVTVNIYIEGGAASPAVSVDNTDRLRKAFYMFFTRLGVDENIDLKIIMGGGYASTVRQFRSNNKLIDCFLLLDMDGKDFYSPLKSQVPSNQKNQDLISVIPFNSLAQLRRDGLKYYQIEDISDHSFFMIQTMETLFLSQADKINACFKEYSIPNSLIESDPLYLSNIEILQIAFPDGELDGLLQRYFVKNNRPLKYGKLKNSFELINHLDTRRLRNHFEDIDRLVEKINLIVSPENN